MLKFFKQYVFKQNLCKIEDRILLAVSGGRDSVVMCDLFAKSGFSFAIAHCNFQLRGEESIRDVYFTEALAKIYNVPFYNIAFNTIDYAKEQGVSIEMAARDLRYQWFNKLADEHAYSLIATAHHLNDSVETVLNNLSRGTGIAGLTGISKKNGKIIRPLLFATREQINDYIKINNLSYCDDRTNDEDMYIRNYIRHHIVPAFEKINPSFINTMQDNMRRLEQSEKVIQEYITNFKIKHVSSTSAEIKITIEALVKSDVVNLILFELLKEYNFNSSTIEQIEDSLYTESGKQFISSTHRLIRDRDFIIIQTFEKNDRKVYTINKTDFEIDKPIHIKIKTESAINYTLLKQKKIAELDSNQLKFPLVIRKWEQGDWFIPFGMKQKKLLSDFFIDNKFTLFDKENTWILCSNNEIVWVIGHRIDSRFKVTEQTKLIYKLVID